MDGARAADRAARREAASVLIAHVRLTRARSVELQHEAQGLQRTCEHTRRTLEINTPRAAAASADRMREVAGLRKALKSSRRIGAAVGTIMVREQLTYDAAFERLRAVASVERRRVLDVAVEILETGEVPGSKTAGSGRGVR